MATNKTINPTSQTVSIPEFTDQPDARVYSNDIDKAIDGINKNYTDIGTLQDGLAIVANGNTHVAISSGQFVYVKNHSTLNDGLYVASANIAANATLSSSNLTADAKGGLNALNDHIVTKLTKQGILLTNGTAATHTFTDNTPFILLIERANTTSTGNSGLYIGYAHNNSHVVPVKESSTCTISISDKTLSITASTTNMEAWIIPLAY